MIVSCPGALMIPLPVSSAANAVANQLRPAILRLNRELRRETRAITGVSPFQILILATILLEPGIGVNELAARERVRPPSMSVHIRQLVAAGLLQRDQEAHEDRRRVGLVITPAGVRLLDEVRQLRTAWLARQIAALSPEGQDAVATAIPFLVALTEQPQEQRPS